MELDGIRLGVAAVSPDRKAIFLALARPDNVKQVREEVVALSLAVSPDNRNLFVSAGTAIMKIALDNFTLQQWRAKVELPCRLICVTETMREAYTVYALGSSYVGDGTKVDEYKTHLYFVPAPVR